MPSCNWDMPGGVLTEVLSTGSRSFQATMASGMNMANMAAGVVQLSSAKKFDELDLTQATANARLANIPFGTPNTPAGTT